ncbi:acetyl-CoA hydrolase/transferase C-terminal domain-containing protein [Variovorax sp. dw_954]|uniref:acetyl-CoA hydrolase/transferase family protein n=1 Tax=Variovorax sp. dw_954 TaxID=2720078 RepID=UPI001BD439B8|nr:acetyl-CoA hydrolase/transferase C-terminal domain-containing protein [Variovorax sp. dw_954]
MRQAGEPLLQDWIRPGDTVMWGQGTAEPLTLTQALVAQRASIARHGRVRVWVGLGFGGTLQPEHADCLDFVGYISGASQRGLAQAGVLDVLPVHYSQLPAMIRSGALKVDVLMLQVPPPGADGRYQLGLAHEYLGAALEVARTVLVEVHPDLPQLHGGPGIGPERVAACFEARHPIVDAPAARIGPVEQAIAAHIAALVENGATLQLGIGAVPEAVPAALLDRRDLGLHSGAAGDGIVALAESGALTHARKIVDKGVGVLGILLGGRRLREFAHRNTSLRLCGTEYTHDPEVLAAQERLVAINGAIEVDLTGQVNAEVADGVYVGAVGGAVDFLRGARRSRGGLPIVGLPARSGARSRIVLNLAGPVSTSRADAGLIVTEYGVADLRDQPLSVRVRRMIAIAAPEHREALERESYTLLARAGAALGPAAFREA